MTKDLGPKNDQVPLASGFICVNEVAMGTFLAISSVVDRDLGAVRDAVAKYVSDAGGTFEARANHIEPSKLCIIGEADRNTSVMYPDGFTEWDEVSKFLSVSLNTPVFSFHIHDGELWMFVAFDNGEEVAWFNPIPDYWGEVTDEERTKWRGDADVVARLVPNLSSTAVERYLVAWDDAALSEGSLKAYEDDEYPIGIDWQLTDFMRKLGFAFPEVNGGKAVGETFYLKIRRPRRRPQDTETSSKPFDPTRPSSPLTIAEPKKSPKPWWRFW